LRKERVSAESEDGGGGEERRLEMEAVLLAG